MEQEYKGFVFKEGDIFLVHSFFKLKLDVIPAPIIREVTKCYYNHVAMVAECAGELFVFEAVSKGFIPTKPLTEWLGECEGKREFAVMRPKSVVDIKEVYENIELLIGNGYSFKALGWTFIWYYITGKWKGEKEVTKDTKIVCSQAISFAYKKLFPEWWLVAGVDLYLSLKLNLVYESNATKVVDYYKKRSTWVYRQNK